METRKFFMKGCGRGAGESVSVQQVAEHKFCTCALVHLTIGRTWGMGGEKEVIGVDMAYLP